MKKALVVGINYYENVSNLFGCVEDAHSVKGVLERDADGTVNFDIQLLTATDPSTAITRNQLKDYVEKLFCDDSDIALFFFAGHGHVEATGGYILASDSNRGDEGLSLNELITLANHSRAKNKIIVLDSCHSGVVGKSSPSETTSQIAEGVTVLTASTEEQYASEDSSGGIFTALFVDALNGVAANILGDISPGSVYAYIDQSLGAWEQRPVFKTNVKSFVSLRKVQPSIELSELRKIVKFFPEPGYEYPLDPTYEPEMKGRDTGMPEPISENVEIFSTLQKYNRNNLVIPVKAPHMWHAAMEYKSCKLTVLGEHYRRLVEKGRI